VNERYCSSCTHDLGAPNVRECGHSIERDSLKARFDNSISAADGRGCQQVRSEFCEAVSEVSGVVIAMPAPRARDLTIDPREIYANYEQLVGAGVRRPAPVNDDRARRLVAGAVFGSYAEHIRYGILALGNEALSNYGTVACRLKGVAVQNRTTFLEMNSYAFVSVLKDGIPPGVRAVWDNRHMLALAKHGHQLQPGQNLNSWQGMLVKSHPGDRSKDDFIEAHVFGTVNVDSIETMVAVPGLEVRPEDQLDIDLAIEQFRRRGTSR